QLPLIYVDYDVLVAGERHPFNGEIIQQDEHGDIVIYTSYRKHVDLPQNVQYARLKTYPEFAREIDGKLVELEAGEPIDIPNGHWIDVRVNMPSNSLYNQKQAEAQRLAKIEAERLAKEEAEHLAEEEERAEQYGLGENNALL
ncbi:phage tail fiber protein, partial [Providencia heimbachae]